MSQQSLGSQQCKLCVDLGLTQCGVTQVGKSTLGNPTNSSAPESAIHSYGHAAHQLSWQSSLMRGWVPRHRPSMTRASLLEAAMLYRRAVVAYWPSTWAHLRSSTTTGMMSLLSMAPCMNSGSVQVA